MTLFFPSVPRDRLHLTIAKQGEPIGCGYFYVVQSRAMALTAFRTSSAFMAWAKDLGLDLESVAEPCEHLQSLPLRGQYRERAWIDTGEFSQIEGVRVRWMSNGEFTLGKMTTDSDGVRVVNYMNPNYDRVHYSTLDSLLLEDAGRWTEA